MKDSLFAILALLSAIGGAYFFWRFQGQEENAGSMNLILAIVLILLAVALGAYFMFNRVNRHEEIHVTE